MVKKYKSALTALLLQLVALFFIIPSHAEINMKQASYQGVVSLSKPEQIKLVDTYKKDADIKKAIDETAIKNAQEVISGDEKPDVYERIYTSGEALDGLNIKQNTKEVGKSAEKTYSLAISYILTGDEKYLAKAREFIITWAGTNKAVGDTVANTNLEKIFRAYDLLKNKFSDVEQKQVEGWMTSVADAVIAREDEHRKKLEEGVASGKVHNHIGLSSVANNHHSHALKIIGMIGFVTTNEKYISYVQNDFMKHLAGSFANPDGSGIDFDARDSVRYHAYSMQEMLKVGQMLSRSGRINYNPYTVKADNGASLERAMKFLLPYSVSDQYAKIHTEYAHSLNYDKKEPDKNRDIARNGTPEYEKKYTLPVLEFAYYFTPKISFIPDGSKEVHEYDVLDLSRQITGKDRKYATLELALNAAIQPR